METKFISDVFLFVAPPDFAERDFPNLSMAAGDEHQLVDIEDLLHWSRQPRIATRRPTFIQMIFCIYATTFGNQLNGLLTSFEQRSGERTALHYLRSVRLWKNRAA